MDEENIQILQEKYQESNSLEEQLQIIIQQSNELKLFGESLKELEKRKENEIFASVGKGVYIKSELKERNFFVDVGAGILVKKTPEEAERIIENQVRKLGELKIQLQEMLESLAMEMQDIIRKLEEK